MSVPLVQFRVFPPREPLKTFNRRDTTAWLTVGDGGTGKTTFVKVCTIRAPFHARDRVLINFLCTASLDR